MLDDETRSTFNRLHAVPVLLVAVLQRGLRARCRNVPWASARRDHRARSDRCRLQARPAHYRPIRLVRPDRYDQGPRILYQRNAEPVSENTLRSWMERAERA